MITAATIIRIIGNHVVAQLPKLVAKVVNTEMLPAVPTSLTTYTVIPVKIIANATEITIALNSPKVLDNGIFYPSNAYVFQKLKTFTQLIA